jgi:hypothetical protein
MTPELDRLMRAYRLPVSQEYTRAPQYATVDRSKVAGRVTDRSKANSRSIARSEASRGVRGTMANRRWGGNASTHRPTVEYFAGGLPASRSQVKTTDDHGTAMPIEHIATLPPTEQERMRAHHVKFYAEYNGGVTPPGYGREEIPKRK